MNVGDYVRTDTGVIEKLEGIHEQNKTNDTIIKLNKMGGGRYAHILDINSEFAEEFDKDFSRGNIIKSSHNIIDLIEKFDFVNGHLVICKMYEDEKDIPTIIKCVGDYYFKEKDIKSIVTKEQFEQMAYKVGD